MNDNDLRALQERKAAELALTEPPMPTPAAMICPTCKAPVVMPANWPQTRRRIELWNALAGNRPMPCPACARADEERRRRHAQEMQERARAAALEAVRANMSATLARCGVPAHWLGAAFDRCPDLPPGLVDACAQWAQNPEGTIFLYGCPGGGKTYLAVAMLRAALYAGLPPAAVRYIGERQFLDTLKAAFDEHGGPPALAAALRRPRLLLYDDLGAARPTPWTCGEIANLLEDRHAKNLPTIITSNLDPDALGRELDARVLSRIAEARNLLQFPARDLRVSGTIGSGAA